MPRHADVSMTDADISQLIDDGVVMTVATISPSGFPHLAPLWYARQGDDLVMWTYARSQKVRNLERDPRVTLMVEAGDTYDELRGAALECSVRLVSDPIDVIAGGVLLHRRYADRNPPGTVDADGVPDAVRAQARKRVVLVCTPITIRSWDHRKPATSAVI